MYSDWEGERFWRDFLYWMQNLLNFFLVLVWQSIPSIQSEALAIVLVVLQLNSFALPRSQLVLSRMETVRTISLRLIKTVFASLIWSAVHWLFTAMCLQKRWPGSQLVLEAESPTLPYQVRQDAQLIEEMEQGSKFLHISLTVETVQFKVIRTRHRKTATLRGWPISPMQIYYKVVEYISIMQWHINSYQILSLSF